VSMLVDLAQQLGYATGSGKALRSAGPDNVGMLVELAEELGHATGSGKASSSLLRADPTFLQHMFVEITQQLGSGWGKILRSALGTRPDPTLLRRVLEPHKRGAILVSAVFDGFFKTYEQRIEDLVRIATGGTGELPPGQLHPDLVNRV